MIGFIVQCENSNCKKTDKLMEPQRCLPKGWIVLSGGEQKERDKEFCCVGCLKAYQDLMNEVV